MKDIPQNNVERSIDTTDKVAELLDHPFESQNVVPCLLADIAVSLAVIADTLIEIQKKDGDAE